MSGTSATKRQCAPCTLRATPRKDSRGLPWLHRLGAPRPTRTLQQNRAQGPLAYRPPCKLPGRVFGPSNEAPGRYVPGAPVTNATSP
eukprot:853973-Alexandrium_andersonii.AAC.1